MPKPLLGDTSSRKTLWPRRLTNNASHEVQINDSATYRFPVATRSRLNDPFASSNTSSTDQRVRQSSATSSADSASTGMLVS